MRGFVGQVIAGRYQLDAFLDEGAFGAVYRATHLAYGVGLREVAIKVSKRPMTDEEARDAFRDALEMSRVADAAPDSDIRDRFVTVHDAGLCPEGGTLAGHPYVVMELVRGGSLSHCLRQGPFPLTRATNYFDQILKAVAFMHSGAIRNNGEPRVIAHRDLKPSNILVTRPDNGPDVVKVADFGLAIEVDKLLGWTESGGDLAYLAPESFSQNICSPQSDVYMLGLVFYEMLTKRNPFAEVGNHLRGSDEQKHAELRRIHLTARQLERFSLLNEHEEMKNFPALCRVIRTALQADVGARKYANACEMMADWQQAKLDSSASRAEHAWETVRRLAGEAEQCFAVQETERGEALLSEAMSINKDKSRVPDSMMVGGAYLLMVKTLLRHRAVEEAGRLAAEGYQRRRCRSTCLALARYYAHLGSPLTANFEQEAETCLDRS
jgi:serine/threonine protein kinase